MNYSEFREQETFDDYSVSNYVWGDQLIKKHGRQNLEDTFLKIARSYNEL